MRRLGGKNLKERIEKKSGSKFLICPGEKEADRMFCGSKREIQLVLCLTHCRAEKWERRDENSIRRVGGTKKTKRSLNGCRQKENARAPTEFPKRPAER